MISCRIPQLRVRFSVAAKPRFQSWQGSTSPLVQALGKHADVFSLCYAQTGTVEEIASLSAMLRDVRRVKALGYPEVVLLGHSAGGLVAQHFVENYPDAGITKVFQVASPNAGAKLAHWGVKLGQVPRDQTPFVASLAPAYRLALLERRQKRVPRHVDFLSVIVHQGPGATGDGVVTKHSQWPRYLQLQGVPFVEVQASHTEVMEQAQAVNFLCELIQQAHPRWPRAVVFAKRKALGLV